MITIQRVKCWLWSIFLLRRREDHGRLSTGGILPKFSPLATFLCLPRRLHHCQCSHLFDNAKRVFVSLSVFGWGPSRVSVSAEWIVSTKKDTETHFPAINDIHKSFLHVYLIRHPFIWTSINLAHLREESIAALLQGCRSFLTHFLYHLAFCKQWRLEIPENEDAVCCVFRDKDFSCQITCFYLFVLVKEVIALLAVTIRILVSLESLTVLVKIVPRHNRVPPHYLQFSIDRQIRVASYAAFWVFIILGFGCFESVPSSMKMGTMFANSCNSAMLHAIMTTSPAYRRLVDVLISIDPSISPSAECMIIIMIFSVDSLTKWYWYI